MVLCMVKVAFTVRIDKELHDKLVQRASELGVSKTKLVEKIIAEYFSYELKEDPLLPLQKLREELEVVKDRLSRLEQQVKELVKTGSGLTRFGSRR